MLEKSTLCAIDNSLSIMREKLSTCGPLISPIAHSLPSKDFCFTIIQHVIKKSDGFVKSILFYEGAVQVISQRIGTIQSKSYIKKGFIETLFLEDEVPAVFEIEALSKNDSRLHYQIVGKFNLTNCF